jgi:hypothetical protein
MATGRGLRSDIKLSNRWDPKSVINPSPPCGEDDLTMSQKKGRKRPDRDRFFANHAAGFPFLTGTIPT